MRASNKLVISLITLVLTGCAATPKLEMPEQKYMEFAQMVNAIDWCINNKYFSMEAHTASIRVMGTVINTWNYDSAKLRETSRNNPVSITETECNRIAANILATQQRWDRQASMASSQPTPVIIPQPTNTFCNRIGTQVLCNSF